MSTRRTFAIISHPDAGKTTLTEQLLLQAGAIQMAGTVKSRKASRYATSDWMALEKERGISVTASVMQMSYGKHLINLLDTPGHADFSEDTYRTLTAVDSALMVIDGGKGVEERTKKLLEVCRMRTTPVMTFVNKWDRLCREPMALMDEIEKVLNIHCVPITWPLGMGREFQGLYHLEKKALWIFDGQGGGRWITDRADWPTDAPNFPEWEEELALLEEVYNEGLDTDAFLRGEATPVFFGSAIQHKGIHHWLDFFVEQAPGPLPRMTASREVLPTEDKLSGFVFKIQANMDPDHHDRVAFFRICSGRFEKGMKAYLTRTQKTLRLNNALTFLASDREQIETAEPGDIIGLITHGGIQVGDTLTQGENLRFSGIPYFAPELFRAVRLADPLKSKALRKGLQELSEEGAIQYFRPIVGFSLIIGAIGVLQFDVVAHRLKHEYGVDCLYENAEISTVRWVSTTSRELPEAFQERLMGHLARDTFGRWVYLAPSRVHLNLTQERWPDIVFHATCEIGTEE